MVDILWSCCYNLQNICPSLISLCEEYHQLLKMQSTLDPFQINMISGQFVKTFDWNFFLYSYNWVRGGKGGLFFEYLESKTAHSKPSCADVLLLAS